MLLRRNVRRARRVPDVDDGVHRRQRRRLRGRRGAAVLSERDVHRQAMLRRRAVRLAGSELRRYPAPRHLRQLGLRHLRGGRTDVLHRRPWRSGGRRELLHDVGRGVQSGTNRCTACGGSGQPCCDGVWCGGGGCCDQTVDTCVANTATCGGGQGKCFEGACLGGGCGGLGQACCGGGVGCTAPFSACQANVCVGCGGPGEPCCPGNNTGGFWCSAGETCVSGSCATCGGNGQPCCAGAECRAGICNAGKCQ